MDIKIKGNLTVAVLLLSIVSLLIVSISLLIDGELFGLVGLIGTAGGVAVLVNNLDNIKSKQDINEVT